jgi:hypothetical protein
MLSHCTFGPERTMIEIRSKLRRLVRQSPVVVLMFGLLLTALWIGLLIGIVVYFVTGFGS